MWFTLALASVAWVQGPARADWASEISGANPLQWYRFDETSGTVANDYGSANLDGTYVGNVGLGLGGSVGAAAAFDAGSHVLLGAPNLAADWTLEAIFKADTAKGSVSMGLIGADFAAASGRMAIKAEQWNETGQMGYTLFGVEDVTFTEAAAATPASFSHVVFVGGATGVSLYVNGAAAGTHATASPLARWAIAAGAVRADGTLVDPLTGTIDELVIYNRALLPTEISSHFQAIPEPTPLTLGATGALALLAFRAAHRRR